MILKIAKVEQYPKKGEIWVYLETKEQQFTLDLLHELGTRLEPLKIKKNQKGAFEYVEIPDDFNEQIKAQIGYFHNNKINNANYSFKKDKEEY